ncbi:chaperone DnaJ protein [Trypanosoma conorhini]|uniref:Chaperone DnaJ protein n=1 Tax=Trypanosoma conorhini TaxID=83891 RepID=A0A3R7KUH2_9TRYP|nr:chaperone DnaJ protein [Trypanosoma conorhini]RNF13700.1 chaperone DnaJ protein [Trypanosoma conorhini]
MRSKRAPASHVSSLASSFDLHPLHTREEADITSTLTPAAEEMRRLSVVVFGARVAPFATTAVALLPAKGGGGSGSGSGLTDEEQRELEEEEFRVMDAEREEAELLPFAYRLAAKADALDAELRRLSYVLFEKPQLVLDTRAATLTGRPANVVAVMRRYHADGTHGGCPAGWVKPSGSSSPLVQAVKVACSAVQRLCGRAKQQRQQPGRLDQLVTLTEDLDYIRRMKRLHALNFYSRMNLTPKRHIWLSLYAMLWNVVVAVQNAVGCVLFGAMRGVRDHGVCVGAVKGATLGLFRATQFLAYGLVVSPCIHLPCGVRNSVYGAWNAVAGTLFFEVSAGRWQYCTALDSAWLRHDIQLEQRAIRGVGRLEFRRKNMRPEERWQQRLASMGFSFDKLNQTMRRMGGGQRQASAAAGEGEDPYEVLQVKRSATQAQIKAQYKNLAKVFHPDVVQSRHGGALSEQERREVQRKFEDISQAYQVLSNPEKRKSFDLGGAQALRLHESKMGRFMSRTPEEMIQSVFGGEPFREKILGALLRSHWHLRNEAQVSVSLHEFEELQCLRCRELTVELARILDVHAKAPPARGKSQQRATHGRTEVLHSMMSELGGTAPRLKSPSSSQRPAATTAAESPFTLTPGSNEDNCFSRDFEERCERFTRRLSEACFGRELMHAVGQSYVISSQRFLRIRPFYAPKLHVYKSIFSGVDRVYAAFREKIDDRAKNNHEWLAQKVMIEYFSMEFDAVVADVSVILRYAAQNVLQDVTLSEEQRRRRCYALWYLGEQMVRKGVPWVAMSRDDAELMAYLQQAANSASTTSKPGPF